MRARVVLLGLLVLPFSTALAAMRLTFIDAGQADAAVVQIEQFTGEPFTIVVDGGDGDTDLKNNLPALLTGDPTIELVVISHPHKDHSGALDWLAISSGVPIRQVWFSDEEHTTDESYIAFIGRVLSQGIPVVRPTETEHAFLGFPNFKLRVFNNGREFPGPASDGASLNNDSVVFQVRYQPAANVLRTALFTGDIEREQGQRLVTQFGAALKSDIVKVPHHGSDNLFPAFPTTVDADFVFVSSSGTNKTFMHPRKSALDLYDTATPNARIFCTCDAAGKTLTFFAIVSSTGAITVSPVAKPFFAWTPVNGVLRKRTFTPGP